MSLLDSFTKKKLLNTAMSQTAKARASEGKAADQLYKSAYHDYAEVLIGDALRADALYHWGVALLHQAKTKIGKEAVDLLQDAIAKFSFCLLVNPSYLGAAIDGGVAYMELARLKSVAVDDELYELAKQFFTKANSIQTGTAAYNLACIHGLRNDKEACLKALETAKDKGFLPDAEEILNDVDLDTVKNQAWFNEFIATITKSVETVSAVTETTTEAEEPKPANIAVDTVVESSEPLSSNSSDSGNSSSDSDSYSASSD